MSKGVTAPSGFKAAGLPCGLKKSGRKDLALICSQVLANAAGIFTSNKIKSASILFTQNQLKAGKAQAIIVNSGNANTCVGKRGVSDCRRVVETLSRQLKIPAKHILMASTGIIGLPLQVKNILSRIKDLTHKLSEKGGHDAAQAIMTTDTRPKETAIEVKLGSKERIVIGGIAKGAGMICPKFGTMLSFLTTDAAINSKALKQALKTAVTKSFDCTIVDGDTSTNDTVLILANGLAGNKEIKPGSKTFQKFQEALNEVCIYLAKEIARDGEGATKFIEVRVTKAKSKKDAQLVARAIVGSNLLKAAIFGEDPNWGRIIAAVGYSKASIDPDKINISIGRQLLVKKGTPLAFDEYKVRKILKGSEILIHVDLGLGKEKAVAWGCDLTYEYVKINAEYET